MIDRLSWYAVLLAAVGFGALKSVLFIQKARFGIALTGPGYFDLANILVAALAAWIAVRGLRRDAGGGQTGVSHAAASDEWPARSFVEDMRQMPETYRKAFRQHPILLTLLMAILAALPIGLLIFATGRDPARFELADWLLLGIAELPMVVAVGLVIRGAFKSPAP